MGGTAPTETFRTPVLGLDAGVAPGPLDHVRIAGFWVRLLAYLIDSVIIGIPLSLLGFAVIGQRLQGVSLNDSASLVQAYSSLGPLLSLLSLLIQSVYFIAMWGTGGTVGMRLLRLAVVDQSTGELLTAGQAVIRFVGYVVSFAVCYLGVLWVAFDRRSQGWHDKMARSLVIHI